MKAKKVYATLALLTTLGISATLAGCADTKSQKQNDIESTISNSEVSEELKPVYEGFLPGQHQVVVMVRSLGDDLAYYDTVDGYEPISSYPSDTEGYIYVIYQNTERVFAEEIYDESTQHYNFSQFGVVVKLENENSNSKSLS